MTRTIRTKCTLLRLARKVVAAITLVAALNGLAGEPAPPASPRAAPANVWVKLAEEGTGVRELPAFWFDPSSSRFVLSAGVGGGKLHFDTETFDAKTGKWANAYPEGAPYKTESGPTDAPGAGFRHREPPLKADGNGVMRIQSGRCFQFARSAADGRLYAYFLDTTIWFDPKARRWMDLKATAFNKYQGMRMAYGTLAYDPVNKEFVSVGGTSDEDGGTSGTWTYSVAANEWRKLSPGSAELKGLNAEARAMYARAAAFINACRNRFYATESEAEAKRDLAAGANETAAAVDALATRLNATRLAGLEANAPKAALAAMTNVSAGFKAMAGKLDGRFAGETLVEAQGLQDALLAAKRALDTEPCGRVASQMTVCESSGKIVLFSGCTMDGFLADTWVYDCRTRSWEQRYPKVSPAPRAGHVLAWLPRSDKVVLFGSQPFTTGFPIPPHKPLAPRDLWTYDIKTNEWKLLAGASKDAPVDGVGSVDGDDLLVVVSRDSKNPAARVTWGLRVDPNAPDAGSAGAGVVPGTMVQSFAGPADFDRASKPDPEGVAKFLKELPANQWTLMPASPRKGNGRGWGTYPYDTVRHQWISFGGGHGGGVLADVTHYSLRTATWSSGYAEEFPPFGNADNNSDWFNQTFWNRPTVGHVWDATDFDPVSGKVILYRRGATWVYDPVRREWEYPLAPSPKGNRKETQYAMTATPRGVVCWTDNDLFLFDAKAAKWSKLPVLGGQVGGAYGDDGGICHDSKRNCLWLGRKGRPMMRYDMKTGTLTTSLVQGTKDIFLRETVYVPEIDMLLNMGRVKGPGGEVGNLAYDIENNKWVGIHLPCSDGQPRLPDGQYWPFGRALSYDPQLKVATLFYGTQEIMALRIDKASLKTFDVTIQEPKKK